MFSYRSAPPRAPSANWQDIIFRTANISTLEKIPTARLPNPERKLPHFISDPKIKNY